MKKNKVWYRVCQRSLVKYVLVVGVLNAAAVDCVLVDDWQEWSQCDSRCGYGVQVRVRHVLVQPRNGGRECGETVERRLCEGTQCKLPRSHRGAVSQLKGPLTLINYRLQP